MFYAYIPVNTDIQTVTNQKYENFLFIDEKTIHIDQWIEESVSSTKRIDERKLGILYLKNCGE